MSGNLSSLCIVGAFIRLVEGINKEEPGTYKIIQPCISTPQGLRLLRIPAADVFQVNIDTPKKAYSGNYDSNTCNMITAGHHVCFWLTLFERLFQ